MRVERTGGDGRVGVSGMGRGFEAGGCLRLGSSLGRRFRRSGMSVAGGACVVEGILCMVFVMLQIASWRGNHIGVG